MKRIFELEEAKEITLGEWYEYGELIGVEHNNNVRAYEQMDLDAEILAFYVNDSFNYMLKRKKEMYEKVAKPF